MPQSKRSFRPIKLLRNRGPILLLAVLILVAAGGYIAWSNKSGASYVSDVNCALFGCNGIRYSVNNTVGDLPTYTLSSNPNVGIALNQAIAQPFSQISYNFLPDRTGTRVTGLNLSSSKTTSLNDDVLIELRQYDRTKTPIDGTLLASSDPTTSADLITLGDTVGTSSAMNFLTKATFKNPLDLADGSYAVLYAPKPYRSVPISLSTGVPDGRIGGLFLTSSGWNELHRNAVMSMSPAILSMADFLPNNTYTLSYKPIAQINKIENTLVETKSNATSPIYNSIATKFEYSGNENQVAGVTIAIAKGSDASLIPKTLQARVFFTTSSSSKPDEGTQLWGGNMTLAPFNNHSTSVFYTFPPKQSNLRFASTNPNGQRIYYSLVLNALGSQENAALVMPVAPFGSGGNGLNPISPTAMPSGNPVTIPFIFKDSTDQKTFTWMTDTDVVSPITMGK